MPQKGLWSVINVVKGASNRISGFQNAISSVRLCTRNSRWLSSKVTVMSKHNTLLEGLSKGKSKDGGLVFSNKSIDSQIQDRVRGTEAAYFFSDDNYKMKKMRGEDVTRASMYEVYKPDAQTNTSASMRSLIDKEFAEFDRPEVPESLKLKLSETKDKIYDLMQRTHLATEDFSTIDKEIKEQIREVDLKLIKALRDIELGEAEPQLVHEQNLEEETQRISALDLAAAFAWLTVIGASWFTFKVVTDDNHRREARRVAPSYIGMLEGIGAVPKAL